MMMDVRRMIHVLWEIDAFSAFHNFVAEAEEKMQGYQAVLGLVTPDLEADSPTDSPEIVDKGLQQTESAVPVACGAVASWEANSEYVSLRMSDRAVHGM